MGTSPDAPAPDVHPPTADPAPAPTTPHGRPAAASAAPDGPRAAESAAPDARPAAGSAALDERPATGSAAADARAAAGSAAADGRPAAGSAEPDGRAAAGSAESDGRAAGGDGSVVTVVEVPAGVRVGHWTGDGTGVTVILPPPGTVGSGEVRGGAPATREFELLSPERMVDRVDAVVLSGGSAFGLAAGDGVMRALRARDEGFPTAYGPVPIVIGMSVFDASVATTPPDATAGRAALRHALDTPPAPAPVAGGDAMPGDAGGAATAAIRVGRVGAGTGAMSGRWLGRQDPGGFGAASARDVSGAVVTAFAVVNALGVIIAPDGSPLLTAPPNDETPPTGTPRPPSDAAPTDNPPPAPGTTPTGDPRPPSDAAPTDNPPPAPGTTPTGDPRRPSGDGAGGGATRAPTGGVTRPFGASSGRENTTLVVVVTDAKLTKGECLLLAQSGHDGMARALHPAHTRFDGDAVVALATGSAVPAGDNDLDTIRATAITVVATAIRTAVPRPGPAV